MARPKKEETGELQVSIEQFTKTRDSVIMSLTNLQHGLAHVQNGITELLRTYMQHTASVISGGGDIENFTLPAIASASAAVEAAQNASTSVAGTVAAPPKEEKKKRKRAEKKEKDPNAPKRPLTAAFLFAQQARPIVKKDLEEALGPDQTLLPNAVNVEVNKRWNELPEEEKEKWRASYRDSMEQWKVQYAEYRATLGDNAHTEDVDVEMHDDEAPTDGAEAAALESDASTDSEDNDAAALAPIAKAPTPPVANTKTPRATKRQKLDNTPKANSAVPNSVAPAVAHTPVPVPGSKAQSQVPAAPSSSVEAAAPAANKKDKKKSKDKPTPQPIAPAPAKEATKEPTPDEQKKKATKSGRATRNTELEEPQTPVAEVKEKKKRDRSKRKSEVAA